jgi:hypothetical protein
MAGAEPCVQFIRAVHRRVVGVRVLEGAAVGVAAAALLALAVAGLLVWRGQRPLAPAAAILAAGALAGVLWGVLRRPAMLWTALEADRQLRLQELLSTAWALRGSNDPWAATVLALAGARVTRLRPRQVVLHRLGARSWGGIAALLLLNAAVLFLYAEPASTLASRAEAPFVDPTNLSALAEGARGPARSRASPRSAAARSGRRSTRQPGRLLRRRGSSDVPRRQPRRRGRWRGAGPDRRRPSPARADNPSAADGGRTGRSRRQRPRDRGATPSRHRRLHPRRRSARSAH